MADILGRRFGRSNPIPYNRSKSFAGSAAFILFSIPAMVLLLSLYAAVLPPTGTDGSSMWRVPLSKLVAIAVFSAAVETLPIEIDNISVFAAASVSSYLLI